MADEATGTTLSRGLTGTVLSGRYHLDSKLGSGGMSTVYLASDGTLERQVAVKVLHQEISDQPDQIERFRREARAVAQLSHPNLVSVIDAGEDGGYPYIVFEYVPGDTLKKRIETVGRLPLDEATAYAIEIGRGLAAAHARRLVHRDVKPQNVLIDPEGRAKVTDFGIARSLESDGLTKTGRVLGTTDYVSPEQAMGRDVDARSDIYSLGILLYEMLTGRPPFVAETLVGVAMKHVNEPMPDVQAARPEVSSALAAVIERATAKEPKKRYPDMSSMVADLEAALEVEVARAGASTGEATTVLDSVRGRRMLPSRRVSIAGVLLVLAGTAAALLIAGLTGGGKDRPPTTTGPPPGTAIPVVAAEDFDPFGDNQTEHPELTGDAIDGDTSTAWTTEDYQNGPAVSDSGKAGVGLIVETAKPVNATALGVRSEQSGWSFSVYAAESGPPDSLAGWGAPVATADDVATDASVPLQLKSPARYYLIWITSLAQTEGGYGVEIDEVGLSS
jgi:serine/threonine-protein kinase